MYVRVVFVAFQIQSGRLGAVSFAYEVEKTMMSADEIRAFAAKLVAKIHEAGCIERKDLKQDLDVGDVSKTIERLHDTSQMIERVSASEVAEALGGEPVHPKDWRRDRAT